MTTTYDCTDPGQRGEGLAAAQRALASQQCVVLPTDTVYGIAADAFSPRAVAALLAAKGRGRNMPPPVLIPRPQTMEGLATRIHPDARALAEAFWPGGLTLIFHTQPSLTWDLGETFGTVALRMPDDRVALDLLTLTGPLAVSSANRTGQPAARTAAEALEQLDGAVAVYLEDGPRAPDAVGSTIVDATSGVLRVVRQGTLSLERLRGVVPSIVGADGQAPDPAGGASPALGAHAAGADVPAAGADAHARGAGPHAAGADVPAAGADADAAPAGEPGRGPVKHQPDRG
ncbi:threonylcarbamoyl-AMP synthase [Arthrobacter crusticola]|uniref:L-threonylcarbamoyladenylate synthase n=1 Tax=Arthrobacter crusticola TaxID=2547960 RepID=A0A4R5U1T5_9MICC|nr:L-threonylcarbamoyladenylate synthase [Arthrobacter crusticola]TDK27599.1 threonylcarbamoyl-AMP synthase [Arthrobacter crusticola]